MIDGWMGDDWFHNGAFRQVNFDYFTGQLTKRGKGTSIAREGYDDYSNFPARRFRRRFRQGVRGRPAAVVAQAQRTPGL